MTRKDYILLARAMRNAKPDSDQSEIAHAQWRHTLRCLALALAADNPRFDAQQFARNANDTPAPLAALRHHVSGAIARGEAEPITEMPAHDSAPISEPDDTPLSRFGRHTLRVLQDFDEWNSDTFDEIASAAQLLDLAVHDENGMFRIR